MEDPTRLHCKVLIDRKVCSTWNIIYKVFLHTKGIECSNKRNVQHIITSINIKSTRDDAREACHADPFFVCCILPLKQVLPPTKKGHVMDTKVTGYGILCVPHKLMKRCTVKEGEYRSRKSVVGIVTNQEACFRVSAEAQAFPLLKNSRLAVVPTQHSYKLASGALPLGVKQQETEEHQSHPSSAQVNNERSYAFVTRTRTTFSSSCLSVAHLLKLMDRVRLGVCLVQQKYIKRSGDVYSQALMYSHTSRQR